MDDLTFRQGMVVMTLWAIGSFILILGLLRHEDLLLMAVGIIVFAMGSITGLVAEAGNERRRKGRM